MLSCNLQLFAGNRLLCRTSQGCSRHLCQEEIHFHYQPRAEIPELLMDVDAFLQVNATDTSLTLSLPRETPSLCCASPLPLILCTKTRLHSIFETPTSRLWRQVRTWSCGVSLSVKCWWAFKLSLLCSFAQFIGLSDVVLAATIQLMKCKMIVFSRAACACARVGK